MEELIKQKLFKQTNGGTAGLDPRCKLLLLIAVGVVSFFLTGELCGLLLVLSVGAFLPWAEAWGRHAGAFWDLSWFPC